MKVAAPSSVITATAPSAPGGVDNDAVRAARTQSVNNWRPNPQAWTDAKARLAGTSGLTTADIESTSRWKPRLTALKPLGVVGALATGAEVAWMLRDNVLYPALGMSDSAVENTYCVRHGNFATDLLGSLVGADCAPWRLDKDYTDLVQGILAPTATPLCITGQGCITLMRVGQYGSNGTFLCLSSSVSSFTVVPGFSFRVQFFGSDGVQRELVVNNLPGSAFYLPGSGCGAGSSTSGWWKQNTGGWGNGASVTVTRVYAEKDGVNVGEALAPSKSDAEWLTRVRCMDGTTRHAVSETFQQEKLGAVPQPASVTLAGCDPVGVDVGMQRAGRGAPATGGGGGWSSVPTSDGSPMGVQSAEVDPAVQDWMTTYPDCWDGSCVLELKKSVGGGVELDCFEAPDQCANWATETQTGSSTYTCYYAQVVVDLAECNVYTRVFDRDKVQQGTGYADPKTGETVKTGTGTTTTTNPGAATVAMNQPAQSADSNRQCWPTGWGIFNPFEWVYLPVKCALEWAFVPSTAKVTQVQTAIRLAAVNSKPGLFATRVGEWQAIAVAGDTGCSGPLVAFNVLGMDYSGYPLSACEAPASTFAMMSRIALTIVFAFGALYAITRYVGGVFGFRGVGSSEST